MTQLSNCKSIKSLKNIAYKMCKSGTTYDQYVDFVEKRIEKENEYHEKIDPNKLYRYRELSDEQLQYLKKFYFRIFTDKNNKSKEKFNRLLSLEKERKEFNEKKNDIISEYKQKKMSELEKYGNHISSDDKNYYTRQRLYNEIYMYNMIIPNVNKSSLRNFILNH